MSLFSRLFLCTGICFSVLMRKPFDGTSFPKKFRQRILIEHIVCRGAQLFSQKIKLFHVRWKFIPNLQIFPEQFFRITISYLIVEAEFQAGGVRNPCGAQLGAWYDNIGQIRDSI